MDIDLESLDLRELNALLAAARRQSRLLARRQPIATVRRQLAAMVARAGYTIEEVLGQAPAGGAVVAKARRRRKLGKAAVKYRDPDNRRNTWTGRGRMPVWLAEKTRRGRSIADFLVPGLARPTLRDKAKIGQKTVFKQG